MSILTKFVKKEVLRIVFYQLAILVGFTLIVFLLKGTYKGLSVFVGGVTYWLPTYLFVRRVSSYAGAHAAKQFIIAFFAGEAVKLILCGVLFVIAIKYIQVQILYALIGLIVSIIAFWIASIMMLLQTKVKI